MRQRQNTQHNIPDSGTWAAVLAKSRHMESDHAHDEHMHAPRIDGAALWVLFDEAVITANAALEREGLPERITVDGDDLERTYALPDSSGRSREFKVTVAVGSEDDAFSCAAVLSFSHTRACIHLVPHIAEYQLRCWLVASHGAEFTPDLVHDLFLSLFGDDPLATFRLSPLAGAELFETPWS